MLLQCRIVFESCAPHYNKAGPSSRNTLTISLPNEHSSRRRPRTLVILSFAKVRCHYVTASFHAQKPLSRRISHLRCSMSKTFRQHHIFTGFEEYFHADGCCWPRHVSKADIIRIALVAAAAICSSKVCRRRRARDIGYNRLGAKFQLPPRGGHSPGQAASGAAASAYSTTTAL